MARINTGTMTVGIFAVLFGLVGAYALRASLIREAPPARPAPKAVNVPLAASDLPAGRRLTLGDMVILPMTQEDITRRKLPLETLMIDSQQVVGRILRSPLKTGEAFLTTNMYNEGTGPDVATKLKPGLRAMTIPIDDLSAVGGQAVVGSSVDVLFRTTARPANEKNHELAIPQTTVTLIEGAEVLAVGRNEALERDRSGGIDLRQANRPVSSNALKSVTLAVTPEQANMLKTCMGRGELYLALRGGSETGHSIMNQMTLENLLGIKGPPAPFVTEIYRGTARQTLSFVGSQVTDEKFGGFQPPPAAPAIDYRTSTDAVNPIGNGGGTNRVPAVNIIVPTMNPLGPTVMPVPMSVPTPMSNPAQQ